MREVWVYEGEAFTVHGFTDAGYTVLPHSGVLPDLDLAAMAALVREPNQHETIRTGYQRLTAAG